jgi:hypothetical protein
MRHILKHYIATGIGDWLRWGKTDVSELRPLRAFRSSPGDSDVDHGMMV